MLFRWALVLALLTVFVRPAWAEQRPTVVVVRARPSDQWAAAERRLVAEVSAAGFEVVVVDSSLLGGPPWRELEGQAVAHDAVAAVRITAKQVGGEAHVFLKDVGRGQRGARHLRIGNVPNAAAGLVLRAVELIHASWYELEPSSPDAPTDDVADVGQTADSPRRPRPAYPPLTTWLALGGLYVSDQVSMMPTLGLGANVSLLPNFALEPEVSGTLLAGGFSVASTNTSVPASHVDLRFVALRMNAMWQPELTGPISLGLGAGAGALLVWSSASDSLSLQGDDDVTSVWLLSARARLGLQLTPHLRLLVAGNAGAGLPSPSILVNLGPGRRETVGSLARPVVDGLLGADWRWQ